MGREFVGSRCGAGGGDSGEPSTTGMFDPKNGRVVVNDEPGPVAAGDCMVSLACFCKLGVSGNDHIGDGIGSSGAVHDVSHVIVGRFGETP